MRSFSRSPANKQRQKKSSTVFQPNATHITWCLSNNSCRAPVGRTCLPTRTLDTTARTVCPIHLCGSGGLFDRRESDARAVIWKASVVLAFNVSQGLFTPVMTCGAALFVNMA